MSWPVKLAFTLQVLWLRAEIKFENVYIISGALKNYYAVMGIKLKNQALKE